MPLYKNGMATIKQPVFVSDVAQGIVNAARDPDTRCQTYQAVGYVLFSIAFYNLVSKCCQQIVSLCEIITLEARGVF